MARKHDRQRFNWRYTAHPDYPEKYCAYCGELAATKDHIPPLSNCFSDGDHWLIPACMECNSTLRNLLLLSVDARKNHLLKRYKKKYSVIIRAADWTVEEIADMGPGLSRTLEALRAQKIWILHRLRKLES